jgi:hypothetical protein
MVLAEVGLEDSEPVHRASMSEMAIINTAPSFGTAAMDSAG